MRIQWDPERNLELAPLDHRSLQVGLSAPVVDRYVDEWIVSLTDATDLFHRIHALVTAREHHEAERLLPREDPYPLAPELAARIGATRSPD